MLLKWIFSCLAFLVDGLQPPKPLPDFVIPCTGDPDLVKCPAQLLERLRPRLVQGISEFRLPPIDPLQLPRVTVTRRGSTIADFTTNITDMIWIGVGGFEILETYVNLDVLVFRLKLRFPYLYVSADAIAQGRILGFEMRGAGDFSCNSTNVVLDIVLNGKRYERRGREFLTWKKEDVGIDYDDFHYIHMHGLFDDPAMSRIFLVAVNNAVRLIGTSTKTFVVDTIGSFIIEAINRVHSLYPKGTLYPSS